jgi:hypothetical protein
VANYRIHRVASQRDLMSGRPNILEAIAIPTQLRSIENDIDSNNLAPVRSVVKTSIATAKVQSSL